MQKVQIYPRSTVSLHGANPASALPTERSNENNLCEVGWRLTSQLDVQTEFLRQVTSNFPGFIFQVRRSGLGRLHFNFISESIGNFMPIAASDAVKHTRKLLALVDSSDLRSILRSRSSDNISSKSLKHRFRLLDSCGAWTGRTFETYVAPTTNETNCSTWNGFAADVTDLVVAEGARDELAFELEAVVSSIPDLLVSTDASNVITLTRSRNGRILGKDSSELIGKPIEALFSGASLACFHDLSRLALSGSSAVRSEFQIILEGKLTTFEISVSSKQNLPSPGQHGFVMVMRDITERRATERHIRDLAYTDSVTGLLNRVALMERLTKIKAECKLSGCNFAIFFIDLDNFKLINDTCGHSAGDLLLQSVASRIATSVRRSDLVARFGGDEFVVVVPNLSQGSLAIDTVKALAMKICDAVASPFLQESREIKISCSIGIYVASSTEETLDHALLVADSAMYAAKSSGRNRWAISSGVSEFLCVRRRYLPTAMGKRISS